MAWHPPTFDFKDRLDTAWAHDQELNLREMAFSPRLRRIKAGEQLCTMISFSVSPKG
jgi:hypothetical protein